MVRRIEPGDAVAQARTLTPHMRKALAMVAAGTHTYGRAVAEALRVPYPQAYHTLHMLSSRDFLETREDTDQPSRKVYRVTPAGRALLHLTKDRSDLADGAIRPRADAVDPWEYAKRMQVGAVLQWLVSHGVVSSHDDLRNVMGCEACDLLISRHGASLTSRCEAHTTLER